MVPEEDTENVEDEDVGGAEEGAKSDKAKPEPDKFDELAADLEEVAEGKDPTNKVAKGLQRVIARKDREIDQLKRSQEDALAEMRAKQDQLEEYILSLNEGQAWVSGTLLDALDDDFRKDAEIDMHRRNAKFQTERGVRNQQRQQATAAQPPEPPAWEQELQSQIKRESDAFVGNLKDMASLLGVKPDNPHLDYGSDDETFNQRTARFRASIAKAQEAELEGGVKEVRGKAVNTRGANIAGEAPTPRDGLSPLERGARARSRNMRAAFA